MKFPRKSYLTAIGILFTSFVKAASSDGACDISSDPTSNGFNAVFYQFTHTTATADETRADTAAYEAYEYKNKKIIGTASSVSNISWSYEPPHVDSGNVNIYGVTVPLNYFTLELTGYFKAPESGTFNFNLTTDNRSAVVGFLASPEAFTCCDTNSQTNGTDFFLNKLADGTSGSATAQLQAGSYYPIRLVYTNYIDWSEFHLNVTTPSGESYKDDWESLIYQFPNSDDGVCPSTSLTTSTWTGSTPSDTTFTSNGTPYSEHLVPSSLTTIDTTSTWTGTTPSDTTFTSNGTPYSEHLVPPSLSTVDTTSTWTGTTPSDTTFTSNGTPYSEHLVPSSLTTIDTTSTWTGTTPSDTTFTSNGTPYSEHLVPPSLSTVDTTSTWTGTTPSDTTFTSNGTPYSEHLVPSSLSTVDTTSTWTGSTPSDTTFTSNGTPYSEHLVPPSLTTIDTTSTWTGSSPSDTTFTSNGTPYSEHLVPGTIVRQETTVTWSETYTTTVTSKCPNGVISVIVQIPCDTTNVQATLTTTTVPCDCSEKATSTSTDGKGNTIIVVGTPNKGASNLADVTLTTTVPCDGTLTTTSTTTNASGSVIVAVGIPTSASTGSVTSPVAVVSEGGANSLTALSIGFIFPLILFALIC